MSRTKFTREMVLELAELKSQNENFPSHSPANFVVAVDKVLEQILEYTAFEEHWERFSTLRLVCKRWRSMSLKAATQCTELPKVYLRCNKKFAQMSYLNKLKLTSEGCQQLLRSITPKLRLLTPQIPFKLYIEEPLKQGDVDFMNEFSSCIAKIHVEFGELNPPTRDHHSLCDTISFELRSLQKITVSWGKEVYHNYIQQLIEKLNTSNLNCVLKYDLLSFFPDTPYPPLPSNLSGVQIRGSANCLEQLRIGMDARLRTIEVYPGIIDLHQQTRMDIVGLAKLLEIHAPTIQELSVKNFVGIEHSVLPPLKLPLMKCLTHLDCDGPILIDMNKSMQTYIPNIQVLKQCIPYCGSYVMTSRFSNSYLPRLKCLTWTSGLCDECEDIHAGPQEVMHLDFPTCPKLSRFTGRFCVPFCDYIVPKIYTSLTHISYLYLKVTKNCGRPMSSEGITDDIIKILTGISPENIPEDESVWPEMLVKKPNAITNLRNLSQLTLDFSNSNCVLGRFIFRAAFLQMTSLRFLLLMSEIMVHQDSVGDWMADHRAISGSLEVIDTLNSSNGKSGNFENV